MKKQNLKQLQAKWYAKLKADGFNDIENTRHPDRPLNDWHGLWFRKYIKKNGADKLQAKQEYYRHAAHLLTNGTIFQNKKHRLMWELHAAGVSLRDIGKKFKIDKMTVSNVLKLYQKLIK